MGRGAESVLKEESEVKQGQFFHYESFTFFSSKLLNTNTPHFHLNYNC